MKDVSVVYALPGQQMTLELSIDDGMTARQLALVSKMDNHFPELDLLSVPIGVYGEKVSEDYVLLPGDRLELYRPLLIDPMEARRRRAAQSPGREN